MFINHIENMGWVTSLVFTESGTDYNIENYFVRVQLNKIEMEYKALEIATTTNNIINKRRSLHLDFERKWQIGSRFTSLTK